MNVLYSTGDWDYESLGNHRAVVYVPKVADAVKVSIPWRRRDLDPENKHIILIDAANGQRITNVLRMKIDREVGELIFQPQTAPGNVFIYYLPYSGTTRAPYPQISYLPPEDTADPDWLARIQRSLQPLTQVEVVEFQAIDALNSFYPMEVIATRSEVANMLAKHSGQPFLVFSEDRRFPIRMRTDLPERWIKTGPGRAVRSQVDRGEFFSFQLGIYAVQQRLEGIRIEFGDLFGNSPEAVIPASALRCFNQGGVDWTGRSFEKVITIEQGQVQALWCGIQVPARLEPGEYLGELRIVVPNLPPVSLSIQLQVSDKALPASGDDEPWRLSRLRWLDSTIALDNEVVAPFTPVEISEKGLDILGRRVILDRSGLPKSIQSFFAIEMTRLVDTGRELLTAPIRLVAIDSHGHSMEWEFGPLTFEQPGPGKVKWKTSAESGDLDLYLDSSFEFDGTLEYQVKLSARQDTRLEDFILEIPLNSEVTRYMLGLGRQGGLRPETYEWNWDVLHKNQDSLWLGDVNAGLQVTLKDENYVRPLNTNFYTLKPLVSPRSWDNHGLGRIQFRDHGGTCLIHCNSGQRSLPANEPLFFNFRLAITPFKPINTQAQWSTRYYHRYHPLKEIRETGANTVNIHHANEINPYINYPFLVPERMKAFVDEGHRLGLKIKFYYTVRELTNHAPEIFALRSLGDEIFSDGPGGGHSWLQEHFVTNYVTGWHVFSLKDVAVVNSGTSRWHNFYLEGLDWLARNMCIDGLYIDDLAFDRIVMQRVRKILNRRRPGALIDLHSANQFRERDGFANSANLYMEHFPYLDRLWFGEYFDYNSPPDFWLVEVSGIPFGLMGEMLQDGGNPWRGMLYGMTGRLPWSGDPRSLWQLWDDFGMQDSQMIGYWVLDCPVRSDHPDVPVTVYLKEQEALISLASWAPKPVTVHLSFDWERLGWKKERVKIFAPAVENFQESKQFSPQDGIPIDPGRGWLLRMEEGDRD